MSNFLFYLVSISTFLNCLFLVSTQTERPFSTTRKCSHNYVQQSISVTTNPMKYINHHFDPNTQNPSLAQKIRITPYFVDFENDLSELVLVTHGKQLVSSAISSIENFLKVVPVDGNFRLQRQCQQSVPGFPSKCVSFNNICSDSLSNTIAEIPEDHLEPSFQFNSTGDVVQTSKGGKGLNDTDYVVYVRGRNQPCLVQQFIETNVFGATCRRDQYGRPIAGFLNLCPGYLRRVDDWGISIKEVAHQLIHMLGMSESLQDQFRRPDGSLYTSIKQSFVFNGIEYPVINTPSVQREVQDHWGCPQIQGAPLEVDDAISNVVGTGFPHGDSHWNGRWTYGELMNALVWSEQTFISALTFAYFNDSGWYEPNFGYAQPLRYGFKEGCLTQLPTVPCSLGSSLFCEEHCINRNIDACTNTHFHKARCDDGHPGYECTHFHPLSEFNPQMRSNDFNFRCNDPRTSQEPSNAQFIEYFGLDSRCTPQSGFASDGGVCLRHRCNNYNPITNRWNSVTIITEVEVISNGVVVIQEKFVTCDRTQECRNLAPVIGLDAFQCPDVDSICIGPKPFECLFGFWSVSLNRCTCNIGYTGPRCTLKDIFIENHIPGPQRPIVMLFLPSAIKLTGAPFGNNLYVLSNMIWKNLHRYYTENVMALYFSPLNNEWRLSASLTDSPLGEPSAKCQINPFIDNGFLQCNNRWEFRFNSPTFQIFPDAIFEIIEITNSPSIFPFTTLVTDSPSATLTPTNLPSTTLPSHKPTPQPTLPTMLPTSNPILIPSTTIKPTLFPSIISSPTSNPSSSPITNNPTLNPSTTNNPTLSPNIPPISTQNPTIKIPNTLRPTTKKPRITTLRPTTTIKPLPLQEENCCVLNEKALLNFSGSHYNDKDSETMLAKKTYNQLCLQYTSRYSCHRRRVCMWMCT